MEKGIISPEEVEKLAILCRLDLSPQEKEKIKDDLASILDYVKNLGEISQSQESDYLPAYHRNTMRQDAEGHSSGQNTEILLSPAPKKENQLIKVKQIISK